MRIYFRVTAECDITRCDVESAAYEYSIEEFDKSERPSRGYCDYFEFDIPDWFSEEEAENLCKKMIYDFKNSEVPFNETLDIVVNKKENFMNSMKEFEEFKVVNSDIQIINMSVYKVYRGNFNDERLVNSIEILVDDLKDKKLVWYDLYLDEKNDNTVRLAPVYLEDNELYFLKSEEGEISVVKMNGFTICFSDDYDEKYIISTQIYCSKK